MTSNSQWLEFQFDTLQGTFIARDLHVYVYSVLYRNEQFSLQTYIIHCTQIALLFNLNSVFMGI